MNRDEEIRIMSLPKMQEKFREAMGKFQYGDKFIIDVGSGIGTEEFFYNFEWKDIEISDAIRLPLPIDPVNPERGLQGMCKGLVTLGKALFKENSWFVTIRKEIDGVYQGFESHKADTPTLALLKALEHQWNVGVEG